MESSKSDSESPDQAEFRGDNKCAQCMQVLYLQSEQVNGIHNLEDIHIQSGTSTATVQLGSGNHSRGSDVTSSILRISNRPSFVE